MSATLRVSDFAENATLFPRPPPVLHTTARQHPVTVHFSRRTSPNYMEEAYKKVSRIHARLPPGGILVFCTGQNEIVALVKRLEKKFGVKAVKERKERLKLVKERAEAKELGKKVKAAAGNPSPVDEVEEEAEGEVESEPGLPLGERPLLIYFPLQSETTLRSRRSILATTRISRRMSTTDFLQKTTRTTSSPATTRT